MSRDEHDRRRRKQESPSANSTPATAPARQRLPRRSVQSRPDDARIVDRRLARRDRFAFREGNFARLTDRNSLSSAMAAGKFTGRRTRLSKNVAGYDLMKSDGWIIRNARHHNRKRHSKFVPLPSAITASRSCLTNTQAERVSPPHATLNDALPLSHLEIL